MIAQPSLSGVPNLRKCTRQHLDEGAESKALVDIIRHDMIAKCIAIDSYRDIIRYIDDRDPATRCMMAKILAAEAKHAHGVAESLEKLPA